MEGKICSSCKIYKDFSGFNKHSSKPDGLQSHCRICTRLRYKERYAANKKQYHEDRKDRKREYDLDKRATVAGRARDLWHKARSRSLSKELEFDIKVEDVVNLIANTSVCPLLGLPIDYGTGKGRLPNSPSLDRILSDKGYTKDNVWLISNRANTIKSDATSEELLSLALNLQARLTI